MELNLIPDEPDTFGDQMGHFNASSIKTEQGLEYSTENLDNISDMDNPTFYAEEQEDREKVKVKVKAKAKAKVKGVVKPKRRKKDDKSTLFQCYQPNCTFVEKLPAMLEHVRTVHSCEKVRKDVQYGYLRCQICKAKYAQGEDKDTHQCYANLEDFQCYVCSFMDKPPKVKEHLKTVHGFSWAGVNRLYGPPREFICDKCKGCFKTQHDMDKHSCFTKDKAVMSEDGLYHCPICPKAYSTIKGIKGHRRLGHVNTRAFQCKSCIFSTKSRNILRRHTERMHEKIRSHKCSNCGKGFYDKYSRDKHVQKCLYGEANTSVSLTTRQSRLPSQYAPGSFLCKKCEAVFDSPQALVHHDKKDHVGKKTFGGKSKCEKCCHDIETHWMPIHLAVDHPSDEALKEVTTKCSMCSNDFPTAEDLSDHLRSTHSSAKKISYTCHLCGKVILGSDAFRWHVAEAHRHLILPCDECSFFSKVHSILSLHIITKHSQEDEKKQRTELLPCDICGMSYTDPKQHMQVRHPDFTLRCGFCRQHLEGKSDQFEHMRVLHELSAEATQNLLDKMPEKQDKKRQICPICGKSLTNIQSHIRLVHEKNYGNKFFCDRCNFSTTVKTSLDRHVEAVHVKSNMFYCDQCPFKNAIQSAVKTHIRMVHEKAKPFKCDRCKMAFAYTRELNKHLAKVHGYVVPNIKDI